MSRLDYPVQDAKERNIGPIEWGVLSDLVFTGTNDPKMILKAFDYATIRNYDPFLGHVAIVNQNRKGPNGYETFEAVWPTLKALVFSAHRTGEFAGLEPMIYGDILPFEFGNHERTTIMAPEYVTCTVFRNVKGSRCAFTETVFFEEFVSLRSGVPTFIWASKPRMMIAKCAKASALRLAFAECDYSAEEMEDKEVIVDDSNKNRSSGNHVVPIADPVQPANISRKSTQENPSYDQDANSNDSFDQIGASGLKWFATHLEAVLKHRAFVPAIVYAQKEVPPQDFQLCKKLILAAETIATSPTGDDILYQFARCWNDAPKEGDRVYEWLTNRIKQRLQLHELSDEVASACFVMISFFRALLKARNRHEAA